MSCTTLERHQVWIYWVAVVVGLVGGLLSSRAAAVAGVLVWPLLAVLLLATFALLSLGEVRRAWTDRRFTSAVLVGNFIVVPIIVAALVHLLPPDPALRLGVALVLLAPCIDWVVTFAQLGRGDPARALAVTPLNLAGQAVLLPFFIWVAGPAALPDVSVSAFLPAVAVVAPPLIGAILLDRWIAIAPVARSMVRAHASRWPVPLLAAVLACVAAAHADALADSASLGLSAATAIFVVFMALAVIVARVLAGVWRLAPAQGRTLAFSLGTRNSFVILPWVLALPAGWEMTAVVVVLQSLVELLGMIVYVWIVPRKVFPENT